MGMGPLPKCLPEIGLKGREDIPPGGEIVNKYSYR